MLKETKKILGLGHPRTGTCYTSNLMRSWGLLVGHELLYRDGIVAWQLATNGEYKLPFMSKCEDVYYDTFNWETIIYNLRNPKDSITSIIFTEKASLNFRNKIANIKMEENRVSMAIQSILYFDKIILEKKPNMIYRIEHDVDKLFEFLSLKYKISWNRIAKIAVNDKKNKRKHPDFGEFKNEFENISDDLKTKINNFCEKYEYPFLY
jgi:hypothetical protein